MTQTIIITSVAVPAASGVIIRSTSQSFWSLINQYQLFLMLPLLRTYLPSQFEIFMREFQVLLFDCSFADFLKRPLIYDNIRELDYEQPDQVYFDSGLESGSHIVNQIPNFALFSFIVLLNIVLLMIYCAFP